MKTLKLTLKKEPFEVMISGEKSEEFRKQTDWVMSRLMNNNGTHKEYDFVEFVNGYSNKRPRFKCVYLGFDFARTDYTKEYSNGLKVDVKFGDVVINPCQRITAAIRNFPTAQSRHTTAFSCKPLPPSLTLYHFAASRSIFERISSAFFTAKLRRLIISERVIG